MRQCKTSVRSLVMPAGWRAVPFCTLDEAKSSYSCFTAWAAAASILLVEASTALLMAMCSSTNRGAMTNSSHVGKYLPATRTHQRVPWKPVLTPSEGSSGTQVCVQYGMRCFILSQVVDMRSCRRGSSGTGCRQAAANEPASPGVRVASHCLSCAHGMPSSACSYSIWPSSISAEGGLPGTGG